MAKKNLFENFSNTLTLAQWTAEFSLVNQLALPDAYYYLEPTGSNDAGDRLYTPREVLASQAPSKEDYLAQLRHREGRKEAWVRTVAKATIQNSTTDPVTVSWPGQAAFAVGANQTSAGLSIPNNSDLTLDNPVGYLMKVQYFKKGVMVRYQVCGDGQSVNTMDTDYDSIRIVEELR